MGGLFLSLGRAYDFFGLVDSVSCRALRQVGFSCCLGAIRPFALNGERLILEIVRILLVLTD